MTNVTISRREALATGAALASLAAVAAVPFAAAAKPAKSAFAGTDMLGLAELVRKKAVSPAELLADTIRRTDAANKRYNFLARPLYERAQKAIAAGLPEGPFTGVPFLVKDLGLELAGERMGDGSNLYKDYRATITSEMALRYERAGLVIYGYTTAPEFGLSPTTESAAYGATLNPWNTRYSSGGSSGGAAVAVAAGVVPGAHGSDGGGSIRIPSSACGLFGLKPSRGRTPMGPPLTEGWGGMSVQHALTISVRDSAALLDATQGIQPGSRYGAPTPGNSYLSEVTRAPGKLRIAYAPAPAGGGQVDAEVAAATAAAAKLLESLGHHVTETKLPGNAVQLAAASGTLTVAYVAANCDARAKLLGQDVKTLVEPMTYDMIVAGRQVRATDLALATQAQQEYAYAISQFMADYDVILQPTLAVLPLPIGYGALANHVSFEEYGRRVGPVAIFTSMWNATGQPSMSVPLGQSKKTGLPIGVMFTGAYGAEGLLFRLAGQLEQAQPWAGRRPPAVPAA